MPGPKPRSASARRTRLALLSIAGAVLGLSALGVLVWLGARRGGEGPAGESAARTDLPAGPGAPALPAAPALAGASAALVAERRSLDASTWRDEVEAERHELVFTRLWDDLRRARDPFAVLERFPFGRLVVGRAGPPEACAPGIEIVRHSRPRDEPSGASRLEWTPDTLRAALADLSERGFRLAESEWHHKTFRRDAGSRARSTFSIVLHGTRSGEGELRQVIQGEIEVTWSPGAAGTDPFPEVIEATRLERLERAGPAAFDTILTLEPPGAGENGAIANPIIARDLDGDGLSEVMALGRNVLLWNRGGGTFEETVVSPGLPQVLNAALLGDLTGDARPDIAAVDGRTRRLFLLEGVEGGGFAAAPRGAWAEGNVILPSVITAGDVDGDGDLDLFLAQYKPAYVEGQMPTPYYDSNDGFPAHLLVNDGRGSFSDHTREAGLEEKRLRRTYGASFVDLDDDGRLDILVTSDFSGIDIYRGDGRGRFEDVTAEWVRERHTFGMSHVFADFDLDGRLDFYVVGMSSTTARRLDSMGLGRTDRADVQAMRSRMSYGNRLYLAREGGFEEAPSSDALARTGWSWGSSAFDFDNDGAPDIYVANGHQSGRSARDYCSTFWRHDIYTGGSRPDPAVAGLFATDMDELMRQEISWNGFEHNALLMNRREKGFLNVGFLMGVAFEADGRSVVSDDLDADGRVDLIVLENRVLPGPRVEQSVRLVRNLVQNLVKNGHESENHWIGVRLREGGPHFSPLGARVTLHAAGGARAACIAAGDSVYAQHAPVVHFGLGASDRADAIEVRWASGAARRLEAPAIDRYHLVEP